MAHETEEGGGARTDGDPVSIQVLSEWTARVATSFRSAARKCRQAQALAVSGWTTLDGEAFQRLLEQGTNNLEAAARKVEQIAAQLDEYARALRQAQARIDRAAALVVEYGL